MSIIVECNVEGIKEYIMVYDRGKYVEFSPSIINYLGKVKVPSIDKIMSKEKAAEIEEEIVNDNAKELFVEALKYNEFIGLHTDAQLLKTMRNVGDCYPRLMKDIEVNNDSISHGLLSFSYKLFVGKDISDIMSNIYVLVDESDMVFDGNFLELIHLNLFLLLLPFWYSLLYVLLCLIIWSMFPI